MNYEETICYKIDQSIEEIERGTKAGGVNVGLLSKKLHEIRRNAMAMEEGLKRRKQIMAENALEDSYQGEKGKMRDATVDKLIVDEIRVNEKMDFEVTIKDKGKVIYHEAVFAGAICCVEKIADIAEDGTISGTCQKLYFGHDFSVFFAFDQLKQGFEDRLTRIIGAMRGMQQRGDLMHPQFKQKILNAMNNRL